MNEFEEEIEKVRKSSKSDKQKNRDIGAIKIFQQKCSVPFPNNKNIKSIIPLNLFQTWCSKDMPPGMQSCVEKIKKLNPEFKYNFYDDNACRNYIKRNFDENIFQAYENIIPAAYKADLWRYCILYKEGGIYLDIKYEPYNGFKFINLTDKERWALDWDRIGVYNAILISIPKNPILLKAINQIVSNVKENFYGNGCLEPTGPRLLSKFFTVDERNNFEIYHDVLNENFDKKFLFFQNMAILKTYSSHLDEKFKKTNPELSYPLLWKNKKIYKI